MLRILLIIAVALAVIIGLMRLTGTRSDDAAPAETAVTTEEVIEDAAAATDGATDAVVDETAAAAEESADALGDAAEAAGETVDDVLDAPAETTEAAPETSAAVTAPAEAETPNN